jgi:hypothetical protein
MMGCDDYAKGRAVVTVSEAETWEQPPLPFPETAIDPTPADVSFATYLNTMEAVAIGNQLHAGVDVLRAELDETAEQIRLLTFAVLGTGVAGLVLAVAVVWAVVL